MGHLLSKLAVDVRGEVSGEGDTEILIEGVAAAATAQAGDLTFAESPAYLAAAAESAATAILVPRQSPALAGKILLRVDQVRVALARLLPLFHPPIAAHPGIDPTARVDASAEIDPTAHIGPGCVIGAGVRIGPRSELRGGNHVGVGSTLGEDVCLYPNVVLYPGTTVGKRVAIHAGTTIGSDGYGYVLDEGRHRKVLQVGTVVIEDDVEIGANCAIDRGALGATVIGLGTKIDNLVHIAHNVVIGRHCLIMGQVGFAGSTVLGDYTVIASQSGIAGHLKLGRQTTVGAKSGVMRDTADGETVLGIPAVSGQDAKRQWVAIQHLPETTRRLRALERRVEALQPGATIAGA